MLRFLCFSGLFLLVHTFTLAQWIYKQRHEYKQTLEPEGKILTGAGQSNLASYENFVSACDSSIFPDIYMDYFNLDNWKKERLENKIRDWQKFPWPVIPQIGLAMTYDGEPEKHFEKKVAEGLYDSTITAFAEGLQAWKGNLMIRLGYEFNGHWNGYEAEPFKSAYRRVAHILRKKFGDRLALVWCMALDGDNHDFMAFFPGDDVVDWWSVDVFGEKHFSHKALQPFLDSAHAHKRPVLIGECSPRKVPVQLGQESVDRWFSPFFKMMADNPGIKGFSYIYWDWSKTRWADWGNGRFGENPLVKAYVLGELKKEVFGGKRKR
jgi:hypothetical protein